MAFADRYLQKHTSGLRLISAPPPDNLKQIIAIPAYKEPDLNPCLNALMQINPFPASTEIIVLFNTPEGAPVQIRQLHEKVISRILNRYDNSETADPSLQLRNEDPNLPDHQSSSNPGYPDNHLAGNLIPGEANRSRKDISGHAGQPAEKVSACHSISLKENLTLHLLHIENLPEKHFGAGLARKLAMDEAARRFNDLGHPRGIILSLDADTVVEPNYVQAVAELFNTYPDTDGCSIHFEHPVSANAIPRNEPDYTQHPDAVYEAITNYELHLRYYLEATRYTGYPFAFHTVGSAFAVQADAYCRYGGMNRRQAGEDFYFIQKVAQNGRFRECNTTTLYPSPRPSDRVLFGTGADITKQLQQPAQPYRTYNPEVFQMLKTFYEESHAFYLRTASSHPADPDHLNVRAEMRKFLAENNFSQDYNEILKNTASEKSFLNRFYKKFNWLWLLRFIHFAEANGFDRVPLEKALQQAYMWNGKTLPTPFDRKNILRDLRNQQKHHT